MPDVDYYDVQAMIRDARLELGRMINELQNELRREIDGVAATLAARTDHLA